MNTEQINELRKLAQAAIIAGESGSYSEFANAKTAFGQAANPAAILALIQQRDELLAAIKDARELVDDWGAYAPAYIQEKHDLAGDLDRLDAAIAKAEAQS